MTGMIDIRDSRPDDVPAIERLYPAAFPDEDLLPLVGDLLREGPAVVSLVAIADKTLVGHVAFTLCGIAGTTDVVALLGPLAVALPYPLPAEWRDAWQSLVLGPAGPAVGGELSVPLVWRRRALWVS